MIKSILKNFFFILDYLIRNSARDLQNTQTQNSNTQKTENPNLNLCVFLGGYVCSEPHKNK
jgi:hypothetical protein